MNSLWVRRAWPPAAIVPPLACALKNNTPRIGLWLPTHESVHSATRSLQHGCCSLDRQIAPFTRPDLQTVRSEFKIRLCRKSDVRGTWELIQEGSRFPSSGLT